MYLRGFEHVNAIMDPWERPQPRHLGDGAAGLGSGMAADASIGRRSRLAHQH